MAIAFHVVANPVATSQIEADGHVIDVLIDIQQLANLLVGLGIGGIGGEGNELIERLAGTAHLNVARVGTLLKLVDFIVIPSEVGEDEMLVVRLTHVHHTHILAIEEEVGGLIALSIDIDLAGLDDGLQGRILETGTVVITTATNLEGTVADIGLGREERILQLLFATKL